MIYAIWGPKNARKRVIWPFQILPEKKKVMRKKIDQKINKIC